MGWETGGPTHLPSGTPSTVQDGTTVRRRHAGALCSTRKGGCRAGLCWALLGSAGLGGCTGGVDWLCSMPRNPVEVPATVLGPAQLRCQDAWGTTTTAPPARMAQACPGL